MIRKFAAAGVFATMLLSFGATSQAQDYYAAPLNSGPPTSSVPIIGGALNVFNAVTAPVLQPILAPGGGPAMAPAPMMMHHHHHRHYAHMMKHKMS